MKKKSTVLFYYLSFLWAEDQMQLKQLIETEQNRQSDTSGTMFFFCDLYSV